MLTRTSRLTCFGVDASGAVTLHQVFDAASEAELKPVKVPGTDLAFMCCHTPFTAQIPHLTPPSSFLHV